MTSFSQSFCLVFLFIISLHLIGIYLYASGFLITSVRINTQSECNDPLMTNTLYSQINHPERCWTTPLTNRTHIYLVDGLRYDFAFSKSGNKFYNDAMKVFDLIESKYPFQASKYHFIADSPTTTAQRVKAIVTGGVPAFIEVSNTFNNVVVDEDSLINQFKKNGLKTVFSGDSLWVDMFPNMFESVSTGPSLDIADLHGVDLICNEALKKHQNESIFDVMITHFLGVDHVGHYHQPDHVVFRDKLIQINDIIEDSFNKISDNAISYVFGDHGLTEEGNHGGGTFEELDAALFIFDKTKSEGKSIQPTSISQVDIVPTIALSMGLPIPYSNTGTPMRDIILGREMNLKNVQKYVNALNITTNQIFRFLYENAQKNVRSNEWIKNIQKDIQRIVKEEIIHFNNLDKLIELMDEHEKLSHLIHTTFVQNNASFKFNYMLIGMIVLIGSILVSLLFITSPKKIKIPIKPTIFGLCIGIIISIPCSFIIKSFSFIELLFITSLLCGELLFIISYFIQLKKLPFTLQTLTSLLPFDLVMFIIISFLFGFGQYTDSFIKEEKYTSFYIGLCSFIVLSYFNYLKTKSIPFIEIIFCIMVGYFEYFTFPFVGYISIIGISLFFFIKYNNWLLAITSLLPIIYHLVKFQSSSLIGIIIPDITYFLSIISMILMFKKKQISFLFCLIPILITILPLNSSIVIAMFIVTIFYFEKQEFNLGVILFYVFIGIHFFFLSGHAFQFSDIQFNAGFIGIPFYSMIANGILIILNTFFFPCICSLMAIIIIVFGRENGIYLFMRSSLCLSTMFIYQAISMMNFTYFVYGHLEIFRLFTPKVCFDCLFCIVIDLMVIVGFGIIILLKKTERREEKSYLD